MLRACALPLVLGAATAAVELFTGSPKLFAGTTGASNARRWLLWHSAMLRGWAVSKTLELCYWIKDIDEDVLKAAQYADDGPGRYGE